MMLTPEQLAALRATIMDDERKFQGAYVTYPVSLKFMQDMMATFDAKQARITELEQDAATERERIKAICGDVIDEWFNCAGGADEVLRRIEEYEQNGEAKP